MKWIQKTYPLSGFFFSCECESLDKSWLDPQPLCFCMSFALF
jgi:hypothetical protein